MISWLLIILLLAGSVLAQNGQRLNRHKFYDTTVVEDFERVRKRRLTADVDSTGIAVYAWGTECYFKVNLLDRMLIVADFYEQGQHNGYPYIKYGNNRWRFRMYVNADNEFEFDAIIRSRPANGRYTIPFNIETQGLRFLFQDSADVYDPPYKTSSPENWNSYAVYHATRKNNVTRSDGSYEEYGCGKAFHINRPRVWDNAGDTVWGFIQINLGVGRMIIGADSAWMHDPTRVYPVTIDPSIGKTVAGASRATIINYTHYMLWATPSTPSANGTIDSARINDGLAATIEDDNYAVVTLWEKGANVASTDTPVSSDSVDVGDGTLNAHWVNLPMSGSIVNGTEYVVSFAGTNNTAFNHRISFDVGSWTDEKRNTDTDFTPPTTFTGASNDDDVKSVAVWWSEPAGGDISHVRRIREGEGQ